MSAPETLYHQIATGLPDAVESKMFGAKCLKAPNGKALAMYWKECMVFKLTGDAAADALSLDGAQVFTPMDGRPMNGWILVPFDYAEHWKSMAEEALAYVREIKK
ncbi:MAG: hypothetical protein IPH31_02450 [Lewinellaceae bacterium]|nr:hypothetical protein [Lewinellaceae bacterium]